jgi:hypothetical protein
MLNTILLAAGFDLGDVRLLRHKDARAAKGRTPCELWRENRLTQAWSSLSGAAAVADALGHTAQAHGG